MIKRNLSTSKVRITHSHNLPLKDLIITTQVYYITKSKNFNDNRAIPTFSLAVAIQQTAIYVCLLQVLGCSLKRYLVTVVIQTHCSLSKCRKRAVYRLVIQMVCSLRLSRKLRLIQNKAQPTDSFAPKAVPFRYIIYKPFCLFSSWLAEF